jgi:hypothetical protein
VTVEPKRRKPPPSGQEEPRPGVSSTPSPGEGAGEGGTEPPASKQRGASGGREPRELRRARIVITVKRTKDYERWLEENPLQAIIAGDGDDESGAEAVAV